MSHFVSGDYVGLIRECTNRTEEYCQPSLALTAGIALRHFLSVPGVGTGGCCRGGRGSGGDGHLRPRPRARQCAALSPQTQSRPRFDGEVRL